MNEPVGGKTYEFLLAQIWAILPCICHNATDVKNNFKVHIFVIHYNKFIFSFMLNIFCRILPNYWEQLLMIRKIYDCQLCLQYGN